MDNDNRREIELIHRISEAVEGYAYNQIVAALSVCLSSTLHLSGIGTQNVVDFLENSEKEYKAKLN